MHVRQELTTPQSILNTGHRAKSTVRNYHQSLQTQDTLPKVDGSVFRVNANDVSFIPKKVDIDRYKTDKASSKKSRTSRVTARNNISTLKARPSITAVETTSESVT